MASGDRRVGTARRGMTVLGKIPAVPKPINLPSQRLENKGLDPSVEIVPRGTFTWGTGRSPPTSGNSWGTAVLASSPPVTNGAWNNISSSQAPNTVGAGGSLPQNTPRPKSAGSTRPSSAPTVTGKVWGGISRLEEQLQPSRFNLTSVDFPTLGSEKNPNLRPQPNTIAFSRPTSADGMKERQTVFSASNRPTSADATKERQALYPGQKNGQLSSKNETDPLDIASNRPTSADSSRQKDFVYPGTPISVDGPFPDTKERDPAYSDTSNRVKFIDVPSTDDHKPLNHVENSSFVRPSSSDGRHATYKDIGMSNGPSPADTNQSFKQRNPVFMAGPGPGGPGAYGRFDVGHNIYPSCMLQHVPGSQGMTIMPGVYPSVPPHRFQGPAYENIDKREVVLLGGCNSVGYGNYHSENMYVEQFGRAEMFQNYTPQFDEAKGNGVMRGNDNAPTHVVGAGRERYYGYGEYMDQREKWPRSDTAYMGHPSSSSINQPDVHNTCGWQRSGVPRRANSTRDESSTSLEMPVILLEKGIPGAHINDGEYTKKTIMSAGRNQRMLENENGVQHPVGKNISCYEGHMISETKILLHKKDENLSSEPENAIKVLPLSVSFAKADNENEVSKVSSRETITHPVSGSVQILSKPNELQLPEVRDQDVLGPQSEKSPIVGKCAPQQSVESIIMTNKSDGEKSESSEKLSSSLTDAENSIENDISESNKNLALRKKIHPSRKSGRGSKKDHLSTSSQTAEKEAPVPVLEFSVAVTKIGTDEVDRFKYHETESSLKNVESAQYSSEHSKSVEGVQVSNEDGTNKKSKRKQPRRFQKDRPHEPHPADKHVEGMVWTPVKSAAVTGELKSVTKDKDIQECDRHRTEHKQHNAPEATLQRAADQIQHLQSAADANCHDKHGQNVMNNPVVNLNKQHPRPVHQQHYTESSQKRQVKQRPLQRIEPQVPVAGESEKHFESTCQDDYTHAHETEGRTSSLPLDRSVGRKNREGNAIYIPKPARQQLLQQQQELCSDPNPVQRDHKEPTNGKNPAGSFSLGSEVRRSKDEVQTHVMKYNARQEIRQQNTNTYSAREKHLNKTVLEDVSVGTLRQEDPIAVKSVNARSIRDKQSAIISDQEHKNNYGLPVDRKKFQSENAKAHVVSIHNESENPRANLAADESKPYTPKTDVQEPVTWKKLARHGRSSVDSVETRVPEPTKKKDDIEIYTPKPARQQQGHQLSLAGHQSHGFVDRTKPVIGKKEQPETKNLANCSTAGNNEDNKADVYDSAKSRKDTKHYVARFGRQQDTQHHYHDEGQQDTHYHQEKQSVQEKQGRRKDEIKLYTPKAVRQQQEEQSVKAANNDSLQGREFTSKQDISLPPDESRSQGYGQSFRHGNSHASKAYKTNPHPQSHRKVRPSFQDREDLKRGSVQELPMQQQNEQPDSFAELTSPSGRTHPSKVKDTITENQKKRLHYQPVSHSLKPQHYQEQELGYEQSEVDHRPVRHERPRRGRGHSSGNRSMN